MPYDKNDPALSAVESRLKSGMGAQDAYYDVFTPNRRKTIGEQQYKNSVATAVKKLKGNFSRCQVQADTWISYETPSAAAEAWKTTGGGFDFLHIHKAGKAKYRVYIPADLRKVEQVISIIWSTPNLTGFKVAGYQDANNRSDVLIAWVIDKPAVEYLANNITSDMLHGMRPPGSSIIKMGCQLGYSEEVEGSSVGTEVTRDLRNQ